MDILYWFLVVLGLVILQGIGAMLGLWLFLLWVSKDRSDPSEGEFPDVD